MDLTQTQPPDRSAGSASNTAGSERAPAGGVDCGNDTSATFIHASLGAFIDEPPENEEGPQSSTRRRCAVRKVPLRNASQERNASSDDDFVDAPPKNQKAAAKKTKPPVKIATRGVGAPHAPTAAEEKKGNYVTVRCSPGSIVEILAAMGKAMKDRLKKFGFSDFLKFSLDAIDNRWLAMFLMDHVEVNPLRIVVEGRELPITPHVVKSVLGLPNGPNPLPIVSGLERNKHQIELRRICDEKGMKQLHDERQRRKPKSKGYSDLKAHEVPRWVIEEFAKKGDGDDWTITCFFMALFDGLLFPTTSLAITGDIYFLCKNIHDVGKFDLCSAVVDDLANKVGKWKKSTAANSSTPSIQGCVVLLLIYYLDNLFCPSHMLNDAKKTPRAAFFSRAIVDNLAKADRKKDHDGMTITYGNLPFRNKTGTCYEDVRGDNAPTPEAAVAPSLKRKRAMTNQASARTAPSAPSATNRTRSDVQPTHAAAPAENASGMSDVSPTSLHHQASARTAPSAPSATNRTRSDVQPTHAAAPAENASGMSDVSPTSLHLTPHFADLISQIGNVKQQNDALKALHVYDRRMDVGMMKFEEGTRLVAQGKLEINEAHKDVVDELRRIFGGVGALGHHAPKRSIYPSS